MVSISGVAGAVPQLPTAPPPAAVSPSDVARNGTVEQIARFVGDHPQLRGAVENALVSAGRASDLSAIVQRVATQIAQPPTANPSTTSVATQVTTATQAALAQPVATATATAQTLTAQAVPASGSVASPAAALIDRGATVLADVRPGTGGLPPSAPGNGAATTPVPAGPTATQTPGDARGTGTVGQATNAAPVPPDGLGKATLLNSGVGDTVRGGVGTMLGPTIAAALFGGASGPGGARFVTADVAQLVAEARSSGQLPELVATARTIDGGLAALATTGGLTARELAMLAAAGVLTSAEAQAARAAGVDAGMGPEFEMPAQIFGYDRAGLIGLIATNKADRPPPWEYMTPEAIALHLAKFDEGAVRVTTRDALLRFGSLGPADGGFVVPYREFADLVKAADDDPQPIEEALGLATGALGTGEMIVARIERAHMIDLRMPTGREGGANAGWVPGGYRAGGMAEAVINFVRQTPATRLSLKAA